MSRRSPHPLTPVVDVDRAPAHPAEQPTVIRLVGTEDLQLLKEEGRDLALRPSLRGSELVAPIDLRPGLSHEYSPAPFLQDAGMPSEGKRLTISQAGVGEEPDESGVSRSPGFLGSTMSCAGLLANQSFFTAYASGPARFLTWMAILLEERGRERREVF